MRITNITELITIKYNILIEISVIIRVSIRIETNIDFAKIRACF